eukprot:Lankesteria_metandrocarpae@DN6693_c0_g1_i1.p1
MSSHRTAALNRNEVGSRLKSPLSPRRRLQLRGEDRSTGEVVVDSDAHELSAASMQPQSNHTPRRSGVRGGSRVITRLPADDDNESSSSSRSRSNRSSRSNNNTGIDSFAPDLAQHN